MKCETHHHQWFWSAVVYLVSFSASLFFSTQCSINRWLFGCCLRRILDKESTRCCRSHMSKGHNFSGWTSSQFANLMGSLECHGSLILTTVLGLRKWRRWWSHVCSQDSLTPHTDFSHRQEWSLVSQDSQPDQTQASLREEQHETKLRASTATSLSQKEIWQNLEKVCKTGSFRNLQRPLPASLSTSTQY